jgi:transcription initiation factor TFIID subunit TAF12
MSICIGSPCAYGGVEAMRAYQQQTLRADQDKTILEQRREAQQLLDIKSSKDAALSGIPPTSDIPSYQQVNQVSPVDVSLGLVNAPIGKTINTFA